MARNVTIQFAGVVSLAAKLDTATERKESMATLCVGQPGKPEHEATPVRAPRTCASCGPITDNTVLRKGIKQGKSYAVVTQEDVAEAKEKFAKEYKGVLNLVPHPAEQFYAATAPGESLHYITPASEAVAGQYATLVKFIGEHPELAFTSLYTPVSATSLYVVTVRQGVLVLEQRTRSQAMKPVPSVGGEPIDMLVRFLEMSLGEEGIVTEYDPEAYEDKYAGALKALAEASEQIVTSTSDAAPATAVVTDADLMAKLAQLKGVA